MSDKVLDAWNTWVTKAETTVLGELTYNQVLSKVQETHELNISICSMIFFLITLPLSIQKEKFVLRELLKINLFPRQWSKTYCKPVFCRLLVKKLKLVEYKKSTWERQA